MADITAHQIHASAATADLDKYLWW